METNGNLNAGTQTEAPKISAPIDLQKRGICVTSPPTGKPIKITGDKPEEFLPHLRDSTLTWINFSVDDIKHDAEYISTLFGFSSSMIQPLLSAYNSGYEDSETELGIKIPAIRVKKFEVKVYPLLILIRQGLVLTIHETEIIRLIRFSRYADTFMRKIKPDTLWQDKQTILLNRIIDENNSANFDHLRQIEEQGDELSKFLVDPQMPRAAIGTEIYNMKHALITYLDALWATIDVLNSLRYGDAEMISDNQKILARTGVLAEDVNTQISLSEHMSEVLASGLEVLQSIYNNQLQILNNKMAMVVAYLTIIGTAVLVPNTIATAMGSAAFNLGPEDMWWYILLLIGSTVVATILAYIWVKKAGWLPKRPD
ncbi:MAG: CorA family divalent cation transporter [Candidatus Thermoplasmatota archaeon]|nr:CorA family divalent cation transporter [Candidatus Thermoplasmatota archaeon]